MLSGPALILGEVVSLCLGSFTLSLVQSVSLLYVCVESWEGVPSLCAISPHSPMVDGLAKYQFENLILIWFITFLQKYWVFCFYFFPGSSEIFASALHIRGGRSSRREWSGGVSWYCVNALYSWTNRGDTVEAHGKDMQMSKKFPYVWSGSIHAVSQIFNRNRSRLW